MSSVEILEELNKHGDKYEWDDLGMGFGIRADTGVFIRIRPFWISLKTIVESNRTKGGVR